MMKRKKIGKLLITMALSAMCVFGSTGITAFAYVDESATTENVVEETKAEEKEKETEKETDAGRVQGEDAFSIPGNAEVLDDITDGSSKEFFTIQTKNNNTFYLVVDRSQNSQNVYMLSAIDESDLQKFLDETEPVTDKEPAVVLPETQETETVAPEVEAPKANQSGNLFLIIGVVILMAGAAGGYYFFKIRPAKEEEDMVSENLEIGDGLETENEDEETEDTEE